MRSSQLKSEIGKELYETHSGMIHLWDGRGRPGAGKKITDAIAAVLSPLRPEL